MTNIDDIIVFSKNYERHLTNHWTVSHDGIRADKKKVDAIMKMSPPINFREVLGMTSYYRMFIRDYAKIAKPLTNLTRGESARVKKCSGCTQRRGLADF